jgi:hypothetical protein
MRKSRRRRLAKNEITIFAGCAKCSQFVLTELLATLIVEAALIPDRLKMPIGFVRFTTA